MKSKKKCFEQYLHYDIQLEDDPERYLDIALPLIGHVVMYFNSLEQSLDKIICENISDRSDSSGLIILHEMNYSTKVHLLTGFVMTFIWR